MGMPVMKEGVYTQLPRNRRQATLYHATRRSTSVGQELEEMREKCINEVWFSQERMGKAG